MVKEGCTVIDVGINRIKDEATGKMKLVGDVDFEGLFLILCCVNRRSSVDFFLTLYVTYYTSRLWSERSVDLL